NEGNAWLLAGDLPHAILAYRRGLRLDPNDKAMRANLAFAREQVTYPSPGVLGRPSRDAWPHWLPCPEAGWVLFGAVFSYGIACVAMTRLWMPRKTRFLSAGLTFLTLFALLVSGLVVHEWQRRQERLHPLVVIAQNGVVLRNGNGANYPARYEGIPLNRG